MKNRLVTWKVRHANGNVILMSLPKMARSKVKAIVDADAKSDGTTVLFFTDKHLAGDVL